MRYDKERLKNDFYSNNIEWDYYMGIKEKIFKK